MQEVLDNALTLFAVLVLGILATVLGSKLVFIIAPPLIVGIVIWLIRSASASASRILQKRVHPARAAPDGARRCAPSQDVNAA